MLEIFKIGVQCDDSAVNTGELAREHVCGSRMLCRACTLRSCQVSKHRAVMRQIE